ncbi:uncharacterized protein [Miscanthus floridulus]|uniref:uncharacterized protein n=1 Tax=Miscanthus floridulus TaxID=154761 RepID=UPI003457E7E4
MRKDHEQAWKQYGYTLMSDGWTDMRGRHLINFLVNSPEGMYFLESVDASSQVHSAIMLADLLQEKIEDIGKDNVVQVVTDNGANYKATGKILMDRIPTLFWSPCAAHCLDLMLKEIGNLKAFKKPIARARHVTTFIYRHGRLLSAMRAQTGGNDLVRAAKTRFATSFLTLKSLYKNKDALKSLFVSEAWIGNNLCTTTAGQQVQDIVLSTEFWNSIEDCLRASTPLLIVLRAVDGDEKPAMPEVTALMNHAKDMIKLSFNISTKQGLLKRIMDIIEKRWVNQMEHPLYGAVLYLNPGKFYPLVKANDDATVGQLRVDWWRSYGGRAIELQRLAKRIMHTKKRNRLLHKRLNDIVFVSYNRKMRTRFQLMREKAGKKYDPLHVDAATGVSQALQGRNLPRKAIATQYYSRSRNVPVPATEDGEEEDEVEDPHDDAEVSECEEDGNVLATEEDKAADPDEFDDGF